MRTLTWGLRQALCCHLLRRLLTSPSQFEESPHVTLDQNLSSFPASPRFLHTVYSQEPPDPPVGFEKIEQMIPMRDGVKLHTIIYAQVSPRASADSFSAHALRHRQHLSRLPSGILKEVIDDGYIFAFQDIRGRFKSDGQFVMLRPLRTSKDPKAIDEGTDTYDTIDWMVKNVPNNNGESGCSELRIPAGS